MPEEPRPVRSHVKDRKRWCGGHEGREHAPAWRMGAHTIAHYECARCGKRMGWCFAMFRPCVCGLHQPR